MRGLAPLAWFFPHQPFVLVHAIAPQYSQYGSIPTLGTQYIVLITERYSKITRAVPAAKKISSHIAHILLDSS